MSRKLILKMSMSLDGFVGGPNGEIDWLFPTTDDAATAWIVEVIGNASLHIMGHRTYRDMASYWPASTLPFAAPMNNIPKMVFTRSGTVDEPSVELATRALRDASAAHGRAQAAGADAEVLDGWLHPQVGGRDMASDIALLKASDAAPIIAHGGASFAASLIEHGLVDEFQLLVHPVVLGQGLPIFANVSQPLFMRLIECRSFAGGAVAKVLEPCKNP